MNENSKSLRDRLSDEMKEVPVLDMHCHLSGERPAAKNLADIVLYHHVWIEMMSSGMDQYAVTKTGLCQEGSDPGMPVDERIRIALPYLKNIRQTACACLLRTILKDLYGVAEGELTEENYLDVAEKVKSKSDDWSREILEDYCHIKRSFSVQETKSWNLVGFGQESIIRFIGPKDKSTIEYIKKFETNDLGPITKASALRKSIEEKVQKTAALNPTFIGIWLPAYVDFAIIPESEINCMLEKMYRDEDLSRIELEHWAAFCIRCELNAVMETPIRTIQTIMAAEVYPPHRSVCGYTSNLANSLPQMLTEFPELHFNMSSASDLLTQDLGILAKHFPNASVMGYWWHTLYPFYIRKSIETRLDMVPANKIIIFFSDAYHAEWSYAKLELIKSILKEVLADKIEQGFYTEKLAVSLFRDIFYENPKRIYRVKEA